MEKDFKVNTKVLFKKNKSGTETYDVSFKGLTRGEILAMRYALENHTTPVGNDVFIYLRNALSMVEDESLRSLL